MGLRKIESIANSNSTRNFLNFTYCNIDDKNAMEIAKFLKDDNRLTTLMLGNNRIGDIGAIAIAESLKINKNLSRLHLNSNRIDDDGAKAIAKSLKSNNSLTTLSLYANYFGIDGATAIIDSLYYNKSITNLDFYVYGISEETWIEFEWRLSVNGLRLVNELFCVVYANPDCEIEC